jgi:hypothetical protein
MILRASNLTLIQDIAYTEIVPQLTHTFSLMIHLCHARSMGFVLSLQEVKKCGSAFFA